MSAPATAVVDWRLPRVLQFGIVLFLGFQVLDMALPRDSAAYVDPGTTGLLSQMLYVLFYAALGGFFYFMRSIKRSIGTVKRRLAKLCGFQGKI